MNLLHSLRALALAMAAVLLGCAGGGPVEQLLAFGPRQQMRASGCPYSTVHIAVATNGGQRDWQIAERVRHGYASALSSAGFRVVETPDHAYWSAFSLLNVSARIDSIFHWSVYMMATHDIAGELQTPLRFAMEGDDPAHLSGFMFLKEVRLRELDTVVQDAGENTAGALVGHALRMCITWTEDEKLRQQLSEEIARIRDEKVQKNLDLGVAGGVTN